VYVGINYDLQATPSRIIDLHVYVGINYELHATPSRIIDLHVYVGINYDLQSTPVVSSIYKCMLVLSRPITYELKLRITIQSNYVGAIPQWAHNTLDIP
jgi:hypothetical protein